MYAHLRGTLETKSPLHVVIDVSGVGYDVTIPLSTFEQLPSVGGAVTLLTTLVVRDDAHRLYGFASNDERAFFRALQSVSGVGPAVALGIVSAIPFGAFRDAVLAGDSAALRRLKGVGKRLSERLVVELRDTMARAAPVGASPPAPADTAAEDAVLALEALGFPRPKAEAALAVVRQDEAARDCDPGELVRRALQVL